MRLVLILFTLIGFSGLQAQTFDFDCYTPMSVSISVDDNSIIQNETAIFTASVTDGEGPYTYRFIDGIGNSLGSQGSNNIYTYTTNTNVSIGEQPNWKVEVTDATGAKVKSDPITLTISAYEALSVNWQIDNNNIGPLYDFNYGAASNLLADIQGSFADDATITVTYNGVPDLFNTDDIENTGIGQPYAADGIQAAVTWGISVTDGFTTATDTVTIDEKDPPLGVIHTGIDISEQSAIEIILNAADYKKVVDDGVEGMRWLVDGVPQNSGLPGGDVFDYTYYGTDELLLDLEAHINAQSEGGSIEITFEVMGGNYPAGWNQIASALIAF